MELTSIMEMVWKYLDATYMIIIPVVYFIGWMLKRSFHVPDEKIPVYIAISAIVLALFFGVPAVITQGAVTIINTVVGCFIQGVLCASVAVYGNQIVKQRTKAQQTVRSNLPK